MTNGNNPGTLDGMVEDELKPVGFRLPASLVERIDAYVAQLRKANPGQLVSRSDAIRVLLEKGLVAAQGERKRK